MPTTPKIRAFQTNAIRDDMTFVDNEPDDCEMCGGTLMLLGRLGRTDHFRCRSCGWDQS
jgi:tRNA(Ile2) C34 agmatinyltransferase TiaS